MGDFEPLPKLVFLKLGPKVVDAFIATMPDDADVDLKEINFRGPNQIANHDEVNFAVDTIDYHSIPLFGYQKGEIVWSTQVPRWPDNVPDWYIRNIDI
ncbi:hypothetical protein MMC34_004827 [Xylographa carneopallida]|nr:hypothetical protein [Xylographa carneopallida]